MAQNLLAEAWPIVEVLEKLHRCKAERPRVALVARGQLERLDRLKDHIPDSESSPLRARLERLIGGSP